jgi:hypothetical protein
MKFNKNDLIHSRNLIKALGKGKWELEGLEILAFADMMKWIGNLQKNIETDLTSEEAAEKAKIEEQQKTDSGTLVPKVIENVVKPMDVSKGIKKVK